MEDKKPQVVSIYKSGNKRIITFITVLLILAILMVIIIISIHPKKSVAPSVTTSLVASNVCMDNKNLPIFKQAVTEVFANNLDQKQLISEIQKIQGYKSDPNCTYIITLYYSNALDYKDAEASLKQFDTYYHGQKLYTGFNVPVLNQQVSNINKLLNQSKQNIIYSKSPGYKSPPASETKP